MFKQIEDQIVIDDGTSSFICSVAEFLEVYPTYAIMPAGMVVVVYDEGGADYMSDGHTQYAIDPSIDTTVLQGYVTALASIKTQIEDTVRTKWWVVYDQTTTDVLYCPYYQQAMSITLPAGQLLSTSNITGSIPADIYSEDNTTTPPTVTYNYTYDVSTNAITHK